MGEIEHAVIGRTHVIRLIGTFTEREHGIALGEEIRRVVPVDSPCLVVNWARIEFMGIYGLGALLENERRIEKHGGRVRHCQLSTHDLQRLKLLKHEDHIQNVFPTEAEAISSCADREKTAGHE